MLVLAAAGATILWIWISEGRDEFAERGTERFEERKNTAEAVGARLEAREDRMEPREVLRPEHELGPEGSAREQQSDGVHDLPLTEDEWSQVAAYSGEDTHRSLGEKLTVHWSRSPAASDPSETGTLSLSGTVRFADGSPAAEALVLGRRASVKCYFTFSDADGSFDAEVDPGMPLVLEAWLARGEESWIGRLAGVEPGARGLALVLAPAASLCVNILNAKSEHLAITIREPSASTALDSPERPAQCSSSARIDASRGFEDLAPGTYLVEVEHRVKPLFGWQLVELASGRASEVTVELQPATLLQVELDGSAEVVRVYLAGGFERALTSRAEGENSWSSFLPAGTYRVEARRADTLAVTEVTLTGERNLTVTLALD